MVIDQRSYVGDIFKRRIYWRFTLGHHHVVVFLIVVVACRVHHVATTSS